MGKVVGIGEIVTVTWKNQRGEEPDVEPEFERKSGEKIFASWGSRLSGGRAQVRKSRNR